MHYSSNFNPRSHEGSDQTNRIRDRQSYNFNPRSHEGSDGCRATRCGSFRISILAPTRGATVAVQLAVAHFVFQSSLPRGERHRQLSFDSGTSRFQSSLPRGERHRSIVFHAVEDFISILAPTRGATLTLMRQSTVTEFQSSLPRGERLSANYSRAFTLSFQSSLPRGERLTVTDIDWEIIKFQSSLPRGERRQKIL